MNSGINLSQDPTDDYIRKNLLFDFYGGLLTKHQQNVYSLRFHEDCSLAEIANQLKITPQAVVDILKRVTARLETLESTLGAVKRNEQQKSHIEEIKSALKNLEDPSFVDLDKAFTRIRVAANLLDEL